MALRETMGKMIEFARLRPYMPGTRKEAYRRNFEGGAQVDLFCVKGRDEYTMIVTRTMAELDTDAKLKKFWTECNTFYEYALVPMLHQTAREWWVYQRRAGYLVRWPLAATAQLSQLALLDVSGPSES